MDGQDISEPKGPTKPHPLFIPPYLLSTYGVPQAMFIWRQIAEQERSPIIKKIHFKKINTQVIRI